MAACDRADDAESTPVTAAASPTATEQNLAKQPVAQPPVTVPPSPTAKPSATPTPQSTGTSAPSPTHTPPPTATPTPLHPLMIEVMRRYEYPGSELSFEQTLEPGVNYSRFLVSYHSEGNKIYSLLNVPWGQTPDGGWPIIIFNHGYIPPDEYRTTERYVDYQDAFARNGYIVFRSDYRGHGESEGRASGGYGSPGYTIDVLNGLAAVKSLPEADPDRIGMWGHSMGGFITLRAMVVSDEIDAGVIWGGVVASYPDLFDRWRRRAGDGPTPTPNPTWASRGRWRTDLFETYGTVEDNPEFWAAISANSYVGDLSGPLQLHHATTDASVPAEFSEVLYEQVLAADRPAELYLYEGDNHNIYANFWTAMQRSIDFFDQHVKGTAD
ncbi:MAG: alpha/beta fold hydrolase [Chloroflexota bacterium]|nr:MAG: alpha/beta fold hydrolase [Chloroflexota bacterium]